MSKVKINRLTVEELREQYTVDQLIRIMRFQNANNPVTNVDDFDEILAMDDNDWRLFDMLHLPKTNRAVVVKSKNKSNKFRASDYKCPCEGLCDISDISKTLTTQVQHIQDTFSTPITIVRGYICGAWAELIGLEQDDPYVKGLAITFTTSDVSGLFKLCTKLYPKQIIEKRVDGVYFSVMSKDV